ncbi:helix-turn-helix domain-containing protein [Nocardia niwae]|uniref:helix-turn-helix domain-containing protein n=1 Tax=Nocardia niwae TaxID=626084 RepID=UPI0007A50E92|nr:helix-turn-helix domain-containing protein [Nocardia niwae]
MNSRSDAQASENELVARNVRRYRRERSMTLGELARRSGLSKQTLSKIEQGAGNPTVETLALLGGALNVSARRLLTEWGTPVYVQRGADSTWTAEGTRSERLLDEVYGSGYVRTLMLRFERSGKQPEIIDGHSLGTLHHLYVVRGKIRTGPVNDPVELAAGDFVRFPGDVPHLYVCLSDRAVVHMVTTVPQVRQFSDTAAGNKIEEVS